MDTAFIKDILLALKAELIRFRFWCVLLFILVSGIVLLVGVMWPKNYATSALLFADETNILEPCCADAQKSHPLTVPCRAREIIYTRGHYGNRSAAARYADKRYTAGTRGSHHSRDTGRP
jgi:hypothetical protein